jgi:predicted small metal-binding protein
MTSRTVPSSSLTNSLEIQYGVVQQNCLSFCCKDIGKDCWFEAQGISKGEIMRKFIKHAEKTHKMEFLSAEVILNVNNAIKR